MAFRAAKMGFCKWVTKSYRRDGRRTLGVLSP